MKNMTIREELEKLEHTQLDPKASFADETRGRLHPEEPRVEDVRTQTGSLLPYCRFSFQIDNFRLTYKL